MKNFALILILFMLIAITSCEQESLTCTEKQQTVLIKEVAGQYNNLLMLAQKDDYATFENYFSANNSVIADGNFIEGDKKGLIIFKIFRYLVSENAIATGEDYDVICCHNTDVYQIIRTRFTRPVDTVIGQLRMENKPMFVYNQPGQITELNHQNGNPARQNRTFHTADYGMIKTQSQEVPDKMDAFSMSVVWTKIEKEWKIEHVHFSSVRILTKTYMLQ
jgi:hypothetical protein